MHYSSNPKKKRQASLGSDGERTDDDSLSCGGDDRSSSHSPNDVHILDGEERVGRLYSNGQLKFSVDNILRPDFGCHSRSLMIASCVKSHSFAPFSSPTSEPSCTLSKSYPDFAGSNGISVPSLPPVLWPAWVYCTRYSDRPSSGPRSRRTRRKAKGAEKRPRTAFTSKQLDRLRCEFQENRYLTEKRRQELACELGLNESQIKIWFQNKRAKIKKQTRCNNTLAIQLMAQGLYNHAAPTACATSLSANEDDDEMSGLEIEADC